MRSLLQLLTSYDKFALLTGAGLSFDKPSKIPLAADVMRGVLGLLRPAIRSDQLIRCLPDRAPLGQAFLRFETLLAVLQACCDPELRILESISNVTARNRNHLICDGLLRMGWHHITCNFDTLIEPPDGGREPGYPILVHDSGFVRWSGQPALCKINGSFRDGRGRRSWKTIRATIHTVGRGGAGFSFEPQRLKYLRHVLTRFPLLVAGYSGSDDFDLLPLLQDVPSRQDIVWIDHREARTAIYESPASARLNERLRHTLCGLADSVRSSSRIRVVGGRTDRILTALAKKQGIHVEGRKDGAGHIGLPQALNAWADSIGLNLDMKRMVVAELFWALGAYDKAVSRFRTMIERKVDYRRMRVRAYLRTAELAGNQGLYAEARSLYLKGFRKAGTYPDLAGEAQQNLGNIALDQGKYSIARSHYERAKDLYSQPRDPMGIAKAVFQLGRIVHDQGRLSEALPRFQESARLLRRTGHTDLLAIAGALLGTVYWQQRKYSLARRHFAQSLEFKKLHQNPRGIAATLFLQAMMALDKKSGISLEQAVSDLETAHDAYDKMGDEMGIAKTAYVSARLDENEGHRERAADQYKLALEISSEINCQKGIAVASQGLARTSSSASAKRKHHRKARRVFAGLECESSHIPSSPDSLDRALEVFP